MHVIQHGTRDAHIVREGADRQRFTETLCYLNDTHTDPMWRRAIASLDPFSRPEHWPERDPLVRILAWTLLDNHFHLLVQEIREGGLAKFMQRFGGSLSMYFNMRYKEKGSLFQSSYRARTVTENEHYQYLAFYILVKNVLDMYPGGLKAAHENFDDAWEWAKQYPYSSFRDVVSGTASPILGDEEGLVAGIISVGDTYKQEARELLDFHLAARGEGFKDIMLEPW